MAVSSAGDFNNDGVDDLIVAASLHDGLGGVNSGAAYVIFGGQGLNGTFNLGDMVGLGGADTFQGFKLSGESALASGDRAGFSVSNLGDVNGDGIDDLAVGAIYANEAAVNTNHGKVYVIFGGQGLTGSLSLGNVGGSIQGIQFVGEAPNDFAAAVAGAGDVNGDGINDILVGGRNNDDGAIDAGSAYVIFGASSLTGTVGLASVGTAVSGFSLLGEAASDRAGISVSSAGDVNGDGFDDLAVGADLNDDGPGTNPGAAYLIFGGDFSNAVTIQGTAGDDTGATALNGTASTDVIVAGLGNDEITNIGANDVARAGAGDDTIEITSETFAKIDGGTGQDTLLVSGDVDMTNISNLSIQSIERIDLSDGTANTLTLNLEDVFDLSETVNALFADANSHNSLVIDGDDPANIGGLSDRVNLEGAAGGHPHDGGAWAASATAGGQTTINGETYNVFDFTSGVDILASVAIHEDVTPPVFIA
ncbi:MAG: integrin alpha [Methyloligellaceae bacterium]